MERMIYSQVKADLAQHVEAGICDTDARVIARTNQAQQLLMDKGIYAELKARYSFCQYDGCITLPRELESILGYALDKHPAKPQNMWYEFLDGGPGEQDCCGVNAIIDRGNVVTYRDICGSKYIRIYCDLNQAAGSTIFLRGLDENGNQVFTNYNGSWINGEYISLESPYPKISTRKYSYLSSVVINQVNIGFIRLYQYDADTSVQSAIAIYAPNELTPTYRRYFLPALAQCNSTDTSPQAHTITVLAKKRFIPIAEDNDELFIANTHALVCAVKALEFRDNNDLATMQGYLNEARLTLNDQAQSHEGGNVSHVNIQGSCLMAGVVNTQ